MTTAQIIGSIAFMFAWLFIAFLGVIIYEYKENKKCKNNSKQ